MRKKYPNYKNNVKKKTDITDIKPRVSKGKIALATLGIVLTASGVTYGIFHEQINSGVANIFKDTKQETQVENNNANSELEFLKNQYAGISAELIEAKESLKVLTEEKTKLLSQKMDLESQVSTYQTEIEALNTTVSQYETAIQNKDTSITTLTEENTTLQARITELEASGEADAEEIANLNAQIEQNNSTISTLQNEKTALETNLATVQASLTTKSEELAEANITIEKVQNDLDSKVAELDSVNALVQEKEEALTQANNLITQKTNEYNSLILQHENEIASKQSEIDSLTETNTALEEELEELRAGDSANAQEIAELQNTINQNQATISALEEQITNSSTTIDNLQKEIDDANAVIESLQQQATTSTSTAYEILNGYTEEVLQGGNKLYGYTSQTDNSCLSNTGTATNAGGFNQFASVDLNSKFKYFSTDKKVLSIDLSKLGLTQNTTTAYFGYCNDENNTDAFNNAKFKLSDLSVVPEAIKFLNGTNMDLTIFTDLFNDVDTPIILDFSDCSLSALTISSNTTDEMNPNITIICPKSTLYETIPEGIYQNLAKYQGYYYVFDEGYFTDENIRTNSTIRSDYSYTLGQVNGLKYHINVALDWFIESNRDHYETYVNNQLQNRHGALKIVAGDTPSDIYFDANGKGLTVRDLYQLYAPYLGAFCNTISMDEYKYKFTGISGLSDENEITTPYTPIYFEITEEYIEPEEE